MTRLRIAAWLWPLLLVLPAGCSSVLAACGENQTSGQPSVPSTTASTMASASTTTPGTPAPQTVSVGRREYRPDDKWSVMTVVNMRMGEGEGQIEALTRVKANVSVSSVEADGIAYSLSFGEATSATEVMGKQTLELLPVAKKTYAVNRTGDEVDAKQAGGTPATDDEMTWLERSVTGPDWLALPARPFLLGQEVPELGGPTSIERDDGTKATARTTVRVVAKEHDHVVVLMMLTYDDALLGRLTCTGRVRIDDGRPLSTECQLRPGVGGTAGSVTTVDYEYL